MLDAIDGKRDALTIFGSDYDTLDGTCIRDYVHVCDLVDANVLGLRWLQNGKGSRVFNLGTGSGFSVREVVNHSRSVTNREVPILEGARRAGDCTKLVSGSSRAVNELGWNPSRSNMETMISDAWRWHQTGQYSE
jgi:UDP-glucose 4-epimerase